MAHSGEDQLNLSSAEQRVVDSLRHARGTERAPAELRERIDAARRARPAAPPRTRIVYGGGLAGALAVLVLALVLILPGGTPGAPSLSQAAALAARGANAPAPAPDPDHPGTDLGRHLDGVYFPNWGTQLGWRATGQRTDRITGRQAVTVYYNVGQARRVAYTIVAAPALATPRGALTVVHGTVLRTLRLGGRLVVTWERRGHTCVLSGPGVPARVLRALAAWQRG